MDEKTQRIAALNDLARHHAPFLAPVPVRFVMTRGIAALSGEDQESIWIKVRAYGDFAAGNDPHREHDFGAFNHAGRKVFWKIDYYAPDLEHGSEAPEDPVQTVRVLTVMLAQEY